MATPPRTRSRWLRFSLRTVLILMLAAGIFFAWFTPRVKRARDQGAAVRALTEAKLPITFTYDYQQVGADGTIAGEASGPVWVRDWLGDDFFHPVVSVKWGGLPVVLMFANGGTLTAAGGVGPGVTPKLEQLMHLSAFRELRELSITANVSDEGLVPIGTLTRLERLHLFRGYDPRAPKGGSAFGDHGVAHLARLARLRHLTLRNRSVTGATLGQLEALPNLESLSLAFTDTNDAGMAHLSAAVSLQELSLNHTLISDESLRHLQTLLKLRTLDLSRTRVSDAGLALLRPLKNLRVLNLTGTATTDVGLAYLHDLTKLTDIDVVDTGVSTTGMVLCEQALPGCRVTPLADWRDTIRHLSDQGIDGRVRLYRTLFKTEQLPALTGMAEVRELCIDRIRIDDAAITALGSLPDLEQLVLWHAPLMEQLVAWNTPHASDDLSALAGSERLRGISLTGTYSPAAVASLADVPQLRQLVYAPTAEDDLSKQHVRAVLAVLPRLVQLERVLLGGPMIDSADIEALRGAMPTVRVEALAEEVNIRDIRSILSDDPAPSND